ncbi:MAG: hypothetical protein UY63_C0013G0005 [Parcubacteria group bacterium GW2011_GWA2_51_10]|nr:MAG: hypothetical protein UY63_C0013G0005 [Parcubacteria group bacterium GW2011_GWA2_51_10]
MKLKPAHEVITEKIVAQSEKLRNMEHGTKMSFEIGGLCARLADLREMFIPEKALQDVIFELRVARLTFLQD